MRPSEGGMGNHGSSYPNDFANHGISLRYLPFAQLLKLRAGETG